MTTQQITKGISITVKTNYRPQLSNPIKSHFVYSYRVTIENNSERTVQLLRRHWYIFDSNADHFEVEGEGVVGLQPILRKLDIHEYESACELTSEIGNMHGTYLMQYMDSGETFYVKIPRFELVAPLKMN